MKHPYGRPSTLRALLLGALLLRAHVLAALLLGAALLAPVGCGRGERDPAPAGTDASHADRELAPADDVSTSPPADSEDRFRVEASRELLPAEVRLLEALRARAPSAESGWMDVALVADEPVAVPGEGRLDLQWGSGHGAHLVFTRFELGPEEIRIEQATFQGRTMRREDPPVATVRRTRVPREALQPALELVAALGSITVERRSRPIGLGARMSSSSHDFYVLVRCRDREDRTRIERHFVGYAGTMTEPRYAGLEVVRDALREALAALPAWRDLPVAEHRGSHVTQAFADNREVMTGEFAWWVQEDSLAWLALAGNPGAIPTLEWLRAHDPEPHERRTKKILALLDDPARWLEGPPEDLEQVE